ncbi:MAG: RNA 2',3'-cyclic phosphodiesterase [Anaerolineales bacterium]|nr:RNA 2',3'-cyclic phosphodiesterase [Anaerolineales bacterium]
MTHRLRIFTALELPASALKELGEIVSRLKPECPRETVRWVRPEGVHLTLQFYGDAEIAVVEKLTAQLAVAAQTCGPLMFTLKELGAFPTFMRPRVLWVGLSGSVAELKQLQRQVETVSRAAGFEPEKRAFAPHLTLGRVNQPLRPQEHGRLANAVKSFRLPNNAPFTCAHLSLMESQLGSGGAKYTQLWAAPLGGSAA